MHVRSVLQKAMASLSAVVDYSSLDSDTCVKLTEGPSATLGADGTFVIAMASILAPVVDVLQNNSHVRAQLLGLLGTYRDFRHERSKWPTSSTCLPRDMVSTQHSAVA